MQNTRQIETNGKQSSSYRLSYIITQATKQFKAVIYATGALEYIMSTLFQFYIIFKPRLAYNCATDIRDFLPLSSFPSELRSQRRQRKLLPFSKHRCC
jgi:hypothetical protein